MDVIQSKSKLALQNSLQQLRGKIREKIVVLREMILEDVAYLEAALDDPNIFHSIILQIGLSRMSTIY